MAGGAAIRFLPFAGRRVAYAATGEGPSLVAPAWWVSHLELDWADAAFRGFWESVGEGHTLVRYDRLGVGMSDHEVLDDDLTLDTDVAVLRAVLDELSLEKVVLLGGSSGGCAAIAFAARFPERVDRLLLCGAYADGSSITTREVRESVASTVRSHWGLGSRVLADIFLGESDSAEQERLARYPYHLGRELAAAIPGATLVPLDGSAHLPWTGDWQAAARALRSVLAPEAPARLAGEPAAALLSSREREVLALIANGLNDREIAEQLVLSRHTVHRHVANIRHKLGRGSRTAAVAEAARLGLL